MRENDVGHNESENINDAVMQALNSIVVMSLDGSFATRALMHQAWNNVILPVQNKIKMKP